MRCDDALELISGYCEGSLDAATQVTFEAHLKSCDTCRVAEQGVRSVWVSLNELPEVDAPAGLRTEVWKRIEAEAVAATAAASEPCQRTPWFAGFFSRRGLAWAGAAAVILVLMAVAIPGDRITAGWWLFGTKTAQEKVELLSAPRIITESGAAYLEYRVRNTTGKSFRLKLKYDAGGKLVEGVSNVPLTAREPATLRVPLQPGAAGGIEGALLWDDAHGSEQSAAFQVSGP